MTGSPLGLPVFLLFKEAVQAVDEDKHHNAGQNIGHIQPHPVCNLGALAGVGFRNEVLPAPAVTADTEDSKQQGTHRQQDAADQEVLKVHDAQTQDGDVAQNGEAQHAGHTQDHQGKTADQAGFLPAPVGQIPDTGHDVLKHSKHGGQSGEGHEDEEEAAPQTAQCHVVEDVGQGDEDQGGTCGGFHTESGAGGEDDQTSGQGYKGIQEDHVDGLAHQGTILFQIAAEDGHGTDTQTQGEEGLVHGSHNHIADTGVCEAVPVGQKVEFQTLRSAVQQAAVDGQNDHNAQQCQHHPLGNTFQTTLKAERADDGCQGHGCDGVESHGFGVLGHGGEHFADSGSVQSHKFTCGSVHKILDHPAGDGAVAHQQDDVAGQGNITVNMPLGALGLQLLVHFDGTLLGTPAQSKFHGHDGQTQQDQTGQIDQNKNSTAVLSGDIGEFPDIADADGAAGAEQNKAQTAAKMFTLHIIFPPKL